MLVICATGCTTLKPWQRGGLTERCLQPSWDPLEASFDIHVHATREAIQGATALGAGSCGCN
jgi:hypothetical protein